MHYTCPAAFAIMASHTTRSTPYVPSEDYSDACESSPCSCGWAEDRETRPSSPISKLDSDFMPLGPWWRVGHEPRPGSPPGPDPEQDRSQPKPPPPKPLPPLLPPNPYPS
ncbi:hypothetical protein BKA65DRAFT_557201 [Rhexocercosporidium sp. MPI-PUGE-AT-0058]|nr:hypothetical protein BKA65DRAFT_557201 [Rhexocercosporidium sp. MPI-PUGE-AT-0058]